MMHGDIQMRFCELKEKDVINRCDCKKLGQICDLVIDECSGQICSIIVPGPPRLCGLLCPDQEYIIPYDRIQRIGTDVVLVEVERDKCLRKCQWDE